MEVLLAKMALPKEFHPFNLELPREFHPFNLGLPREFQLLTWDLPRSSILSTWNYPRNSICMKGVPMLSGIWDTHTTYMKASFFRWNFINPDLSQLPKLFNINNINIHYVV